MNSTINNKLSILKEITATNKIGTIPAVFSNDTTTSYSAYNLRNVSYTNSQADVNKAIVIGTEDISLLTNAPSDIDTTAWYIARFIFTVPKKDTVGIHSVVVCLIELDPNPGITWSCVYDTATSTWSDWIKGENKIKQTALEERNNALSDMILNNSYGAGLAIDENYILVDTDSKAIGINWSYKEA